jgi:hypothetical protein
MIDNGRMYYWRPERDEDDDNRGPRHDGRESPTFRRQALLTRSLFAKWPDDISFPTTEGSRPRSGYQGPTILILDGSRSHHPVEFVAECEQRNIYVLFLVPPTFGLMKRDFAQFTLDLPLSPQSNKGVKMMGA